MTSSNPDFDLIDDRFRMEVNSDGFVLRLGEPIAFSAEALFTSLMRIGVSYSDALETTRKVVGTMADWRKAHAQSDWIPTTADIRTAVMRGFVTLANERQYGAEQVGFWFSAYVRRFGNPQNDCIKVIDNDEYLDLNYEYVTNVILPHLFSRIVGLDRADNPLERYGDTIFPRQTRDHMAKAVVAYTRELNVYAIRYKTLLNLLQDYVLEPPHPWIVTDKTIARVTEYNVERAAAHFADIVKGGPEYGFEYSAKECIRHICAAVLSRYGCFLGVDHKYGLFELKRVLSLRLGNPELWGSCRLTDLIPDMQQAGVDFNAYMRLLNSAQNLWHNPPRETRNEQLLRCADNLIQLSVRILSASADEPLAVGTS